jgi:hypothetical protein
MAAVDQFETFVALLTDEQRRALAPEIATRRRDLLAARSEDARERIAADFLDGLRARAGDPKR